jgi:hypothetical protein
MERIGQEQQQTEERNTAMKSRKLLTITAFIGLLALGASHIQAQEDVVQKINIKVTARQTVDEGWNGNVYTWSIDSMKINTKTILSLLGTATANDFTGASLVSVNFGDSIQVRKGSDVLADVSSFFTEDSSYDVYKEKYNYSTGQDKYNGYWTQTIGFNDGAGHRFNLTGLVKESYSASAANSSYVRKISDSQTLNNGSGTGMWEGNFIVTSGNISVKGNGTDTW